MNEPQPPLKDYAEQPSLFFPEATPPPTTNPPPPLVHSALPTADSALGACALAYAEHLRVTDHSVYTITCFLSDLRLLAEFAGRDTPLRELTKQRLGEWLTYLRWERGAKPAPKTMARRVTFLRNFFGWLAQEQILPGDLSGEIVLARPAPPLPELLFDEEITRLEQAAATDPRCHLLVLLLLSTGLKKEEVMALRLRHVDLSDPDHPAIEIHFPGEAKRRRERRMDLPAEWTPVYERYIVRYQPQDRVFECTDRNLNYVLTGAVRRAGLVKRVTLQLLRDVYAVRQLRAGIPLETLRERLGLSEEAWYETADKYRKLAFST